MVNISSQERAEIVSLYQARLEQEMPEHAVVGWGSREDQWLRFSQLFRGLEPTGKRILDVGCGLGHLVEFLDQQTGGDFEYLGVDLAPGLIAQAQEKAANSQRRFQVCDLLADKEDLGRFDIAVLSGALSYRVDDNLGLARSMIQRMSELADQSVALNFLSSYVDFELEKNFHYEPELMFAFAKSLCPRVALFHDYPLYEFTLQLQLGQG